MYRFMEILKHTVRTASYGNMDHSIHGNMIRTGSRTDSGMRMNFTWHGSGMERV